MKFNDKMYVLEKRVELPSPANLPEDWLSRLAQKCGEILKLSASDILSLTENFLKHAGSESDYRIKKSLRETLKHLYQLFYLNEKDGDLFAIATKLQEGAGKCSPGFHDRVNSALDGYLRPTNLNGLLEQIRVDIVEATASQNTKAIHVHNRFYTIAKTEGYGIEALNMADIHHGGLGDHIIKQKLQHAFDYKYKSLGLFVQLSDIIRSNLHVKFGYTGLKKASSENAEEEKANEEMNTIERGVQGYLYNDYQKFIDYLESLLKIDDNPFETEDYLIVNDDSVVLDLNWPRINQDIIHKLHASGYIDLDDWERDSLNNLCAGKSVALIPFAFPTDLFIKNTKKISALLSLSGNEKQFDVSEEQIKTEINRLEDNTRKIDALGFFCEVYKINGKSIAPLIAFGKEKGFLPELNALDNLRNNQLQVAMITGKNSSIFLSQLSILDKKQQRQVLMHKNKSNWNALMLAVYHQPDSALKILEALENLSNEDKAHILKQDADGWNALTLAARYAPDLLPKILKSMESLSNEDKKAILNQKLKDNDWNVLMVAACYHPNSVPLLLEAMGSLSYTDKTAILKHKTKIDGRNVFTLAVFLRPESFPKLLAAINHLSNEDKAIILKQSDNDGWSVLTAAADSHPEFVPKILESMGSLSNEDRGAILKQKTKDGWNPIMLAVRSQADCLPEILQAMKSISNDDKAAILKQTSKNGWNVLKLAVKYYPQAVSSILSAMESLSKEDKRFILYQRKKSKWPVRIFSNKEEKLNVLQLAKSKHSFLENYNQILKFMNDQIEETNESEKNVSPDLRLR